MPLNQARVTRAVSRTWSGVGHVLRVRSVLEWVGVWGLVTSTASAILLGVWTTLQGWPWPIVITIALGVWACVAVIWRASRGPGQPVASVIDPQIVAARWRAIGDGFAALDPMLHLGWSRNVDTGETRWFYLSSGSEDSRDLCRARAEEAGAQLRHTPGFAATWPALLAVPEPADRWYATVQQLAPTEGFSGGGWSHGHETISGSLPGFKDASVRACVRLAALALS
jgi:hypothetical protein